MRFWTMAAAATVLAGSAAMGAGSPAADAKGNLVVKRFLIGQLQPNTDEFVATGGRGTTNVFRDNVIQFVFSAPVDFNTLNERTIKIGVPSGPTLFIDAEGSYYRYAVKELFSGQFVTKRVYRNRVIFDPTSRQEISTHQNPYGLLDNSTYTVTVPGIDGGDTKVVKSEDGRPNLQTFTTTFRTTAKYIQDYVQPQITKVVGIDNPLEDLQGRVNVDSRADIVAFFSEPMLPSTFDPNSSFRVLNTSLVPPRYVTGTIRAAPDGLSFTYRPAFGYGRGPSNITVTLTTAIADRSGNVLNRGGTYNFTSELDASAPSYNELLENFITGDFEDTTYPALVAKANWAKTPAGILEGTFANANLEILYSVGNAQLAYPWWVSPVRVQNSYPSGNMGGTPRTFSGFQWRDAYPGQYNGTYPNVAIQIGHTATGTVDQTGNWAASFSTAPLAVFSGAYTPPQTGEWRAGPNFTTNFAYNGTNGVVLDINSQASGTVQAYWRRNQNGTNTHYDTLVTTSYSTSQFDIRFLYLVDKSEAQSKWYNTAAITPSYLSPIAIASKPAGTVITVTYQGAHAHPTLPLGTPPNYNVDLNTLSPWVLDPQYGLAGFQFIRFNVQMQSNLSSGLKPSIDSLTMPYIYY